MPLVRFKQCRIIWDRNKLRFPKTLKIQRVKHKRIRQFSIRMESKQRKSHCRKEGGCGLWYADGLVPGPSWPENMQTSNVPDPFPNKLRIARWQGRGGAWLWRCFSSAILLPSSIFSGMYKRFDVNGNFPYLRLVSRLENAFGTFLIVYSQTRRLSKASIDWV